MSVEGRPHNITIILNALSSLVAVLALILSYWAFDQSQKAEETARRPKPYITSSSLSYEFRKSSPNLPKNHILLIVKHGYTIENAGQSTASLRPDSDLEILEPTPPHPLPSSLIDANLKDGLRDRPILSLDKLNLEHHPGQRQSREDGLVYLLGDTAIAELTTQCEAANFHWSPIKRKLEFAWDGSSPIIREFETRINEKHLCFTLGEFLRSQPNWLLPGRAVAP